MFIVILGIAFIVIAMLGKWNWLFYGLILLCPLLHFFGHNHGGHNHQGGHNHGGHNHGGQNNDRQQHKH